MGYDNLEDYVDSSDAPRWLKKTRGEILRLLGIKDLQESDKKVKFYYYKNPFNEANKESSQRQVIVFTNSELIIIGTPIFNSKSQLESIEIQTVRVKDIHKLIFKTSTNDYDTNVVLEIYMKDGSMICLHDNDANVYWRSSYEERIREIVQYLLSIM